MSRPARTASHQFWISLVSALLLVASAQASTPDGWKALQANRDAEAIDLFTAALKKDPEDLRALMGLSYAYGLRLDAKRSWETFMKALAETDDPHPYVYASVLSRRLQYAVNEPTSGLEQILTDIVSRPDRTGILQSMAFEMLGGIEERRGNIPAAQAWYDRIGALMNWRVIGPFDNISGSGHDRIFPPEQEDVPEAEYDGQNGGKVRWFTPTRFRLDRWIDFDRLFPTVQGVFYAVTYVRSDAKQRVQLRLGTSGAYKLFLNGSLASESVEENNNDLDTYVAEVTLQKGWNRLLIKADNSELNRCNFLLRITDRRGQPVQGLELSTLRQDTPGVDAEASAVANPLVQALHKSWKADPDELEHAWLLIEAHLRNDQVNEAEEIVESALRYAPDCISTLMLAIETYQRAQRNDEVVATIERIVALRPDLPIALVYAFQQARSSDRPDDAEALVSRIKDALPGSTDYYDAAIAIARDRQRYADVLALQIEAFETHPDNVSFAATAALAAMRRTGDHNAALEIVDRHLKSAYTETGLLLKAGFQADAVRWDAWERTYQELFVLAPAAPGYHVRMANTFASRNLYDKALAATREALTDAPSVSNLWHTAGTYTRAIGNTTQAREYFATALRLDPANFDAREALRELDGSPPPFSLTQRESIDSLIASAPTAEDLPEAEAVVLLDEKRRVVYDGSRCEVEYEQLIRVLTTDGIDQYKETYLPGGGSSSLIVEKAVVRKANGSEIPADRNKSYAVFKSLEPGDFIYFKTRIREYSTGRLAPYFMDEYVFNDDVPVQHARYQLLVPRGIKFQYVTSNGVVDMKPSSTSYGDLFTWETRNEQPIVYEDGMPGYSDVVRLLQISSVPSWKEMIDWYHDIARTKTRSSLQIRQLMDSLFPKNSGASKEEIIRGVYRFITSTIRYSAVPFRQSGIVPQKARDVLATRIGDCKDVATLCIAMLAERNIESYHVLVETNTYASSRQRLPSIPFDHAIVMVNMDGKPLYLDLTADDVPVGSVPFADLDAFCLVIHPGWSLPERIHRRLFTPNNVNVNTAIVLNTDLSATITQRFTHTGARTQFFRSAWKGASRTELERSLTEDLAADFPEVRLVSYTINDLDTLTSSLTYELSFEVPNFLMEAGDLYVVKVPWYSPYEPNTALSYAARSYPLVSQSYIDTLSEEVTVSLPAGYDALGIKAQEVEDHPIARVERSAEQREATLDLRRREITRREVVTTGEYAGFRQFYNAVLRSDRQAVILAPDGTVVAKPSSSGAPGAR